MGELLGNCWGNFENNWEKLWGILGGFETRDRLKVGKLSSQNHWASNI